MTKKIHPKIANRRMQNRKLVAMVAIFDNGDLEFDIPETYRIPQNLRYLKVKLEEAKTKIESELTS